MASSRFPFYPKLVWYLDQGSPSSDKWIYRLTISTSNDGVNFETIKDDDGQEVIYYGNSDRNTVARNYFPRVSFTFHGNLYETILPYCSQFLFHLHLFEVYKTKNMLLE